MNKLLLTASVCCLVGGGYIYTHPEKEITVTVPVSVNTEVLKQEIVESFEAVKVAVNKVKETIKTEYAPSYLSPDFEYEFTADDSDRGAFSEADTGIYKSYSGVQLVALMEQGDMLAHQVVARQLIESNEPLIASQVLFNSALYGDVESLRTVSFNRSILSAYVDAGIITRSEALTEMLLPTNYPGDLKRAARISQLSVKNVMEIRGERNSGLIELDMDNQGEIKFTNDERTVAKLIGFNIYEKMENARIERGLNDFDNKGESALLKEYLASR